MCEERIEVGVAYVSQHDHHCNVANGRATTFASERDLGGVRVGELTPAMTTAEQVRRRLPLLVERRQRLGHFFGGPSLGSVFLPERFDGLGMRLQLGPSDAPEECRGVAAVV
jgi:hypothetical protein